MTKQISQPRVVFMGTPEFAVASLDALIKNGFNVVGVITAPDKPAGRGMKTTTSAVKNYALEHQLHLLQPPKLKEPEFIEQLKALRADVQVVVAFRMLPEVVWNMPALGTVNVHASLLPDYRGAAPINWAIINGETKTGVTTFKLAQEIDTGNILLQQEVPIDENETASELHDALKEAGALILIKTLKGLIDGSILEQPQNEMATNENKRPKHAPKIFTETCKIDWNKTAAEIYNLIRGLSPYPAAFTQLQGKLFKIYNADKTNEPVRREPGSFETDNKTFLRFVCADGYLYARQIQAEGKKRMNIEDFLKGFRP
ncbi:MAG: methionyl-tRNA formyltransferase [Flavitalea sp.]